MDTQKIGKFLKTLRNGKNMTQKLAEYTCFRQNRFSLGSGSDYPMCDSNRTC